MKIFNAISVEFHHNVNCFVSLFSSSPVENGNQISTIPFCNVRYGRPSIDFQDLSSPIRQNTIPNYLSRNFCPSDRLDLKATEFN